MPRLRIRVDAVIGNRVLRRIKMGAFDKLTVTVEDRHIREGHRTDVLSCPVALAVNDAVAALGQPTASYAIVSPYQIDIEAGSVPSVLKATYSTPPQVRLWMIDFDQYKAVEPFTFTLEIGGSSYDDVSRSS